MSSQPPSCTTFWKTPMRSSELEARFGSEVSDLVALVSDDASVTDEEARKDECVRESAALAGTPPSSTPRTRSQRRESSARCCTGVTDYLLVAGIVFGINLLPAFVPPTSAVLVALTLSFDLASAPLIACGAIAAASGRLLLAAATRRLRPHLSAERREHLAAAEESLLDHPAKTVAGLGLFALSPCQAGSCSSRRV
jgi:hypothetical protein